MYFLRHPWKFLSTSLPKSLYKRFVLIIVLPIFLIQIFSLSFFINRNWIQNSNKYIENVVQQIAYVKNLYYNNKCRFDALNGKFLKIRFKEVFIVNNEKNFQNKRLNPLNLHMLKKALRKNSLHDFKIYKNIRDVVIILKVENSEIEFRINAGDILFASNHVFIFFNIFVSLIFLGIAWLFMKNQVIPIINLSNAMNDFSNCHSVFNITPRGALEIKNAIKSFNKMSEELVHYISEQNIALAGVSHDIKTYITRMKLQVALLKDEKIASDMNSDIVEMENIISEFIDYVKSETYSKDQFCDVNVEVILRDICKKFSIQYDLDIEGNAVVKGNENALKRCFLNIISNAAKFAQICKISISSKNGIVQVIIEDNGPGVDNSEIDFLTKPFYKVDKSRNMKHGGVGLGLAITNNIVLKHNGNIAFQKSSLLGGLKVTVTLPQ